MGMTGSEISPRIMSGYGLVNERFDRVVRALSRSNRGSGSKIALVRETGLADEALAYMDIRTWPASRLLVVDLGPWCAILTNSRNGSDFNDHQRWATQTLGERTLRVVDDEAQTWRRGTQRMRIGYDARIVELRDGDGSTRRSIACMNDGGRWVFETSGQPLPIEASFPYDAPRSRDRFSSEHLAVLLRSLGVEPLTLQSLRAAPRFALLSETPTNKEVRRKVERFACSAAEADDPAFLHYMSGMRYADRMDLFGAERVIQSLERAVELNPDYEPRVRDTLAKARRRAR